MATELDPLHILGKAINDLRAEIAAVKKAAPVTTPAAPPAKPVKPAAKTPAEAVEGCDCVICETVRGLGD